MTESTWKILKIGPEKLYFLQPAEADAVLILVCLSVCLSVRPGLLAHLTDFV